MMSPSAGEIVLNTHIVYVYTVVFHFIPSFVFSVEVQSVTARSHTLHHDSRS